MPGGPGAPPSSGPVIVVTKAELGEGSTRRAQGGIAAALDGGDSVEAHLADTLAAGAGLCDVDAAAAHLPRRGPPRSPSCSPGAWRSTATADGLSLGPRGRPLGLARGRTPAATPPARTSSPRSRRPCGADPRDRARRGRARPARCSCATAASPACAPWTADGVERVRAGPGRGPGGRAAPGQLYPLTTNPPGATADGPALAARAGAALADLEMVQFHPTALALGPSPLSLVSEAVRGEGGVPARRRRAALHARRAPDGRAGPARRGGPRHRPPRRRDRRRRRGHSTCATSTPSLVLRRFPTVAALCAEHGLDLARDPIPVTPAAHYAVGGALADMEGRTTRPGPLRHRRVRGDGRARRQPARLQRPARGRGAGLRRGARAGRRPGRLARGPLGGRGVAAPRERRRPRGARRPAGRRCGAAWASSATPTASRTRPRCWPRSPTAPTPRPTTSCWSRG